MTELPVKIKDLPHNSSLPYNGRVVRQNNLVFSFTSFDRNHQLFNLGNDLAKSMPMKSEWFLSLLDTLKEASSKPISELKQAPFYLHPIKWEHTNAQKPNFDCQLEYWQFRLSKAKGRIIGFKIPIETYSIFYILWLDAHHNLTDSEGYGKAQYFAKPLNAYEILEKCNEELRMQLSKLQEDLKVAEELLNENS